MHTYVIIIMKMAYVKFILTCGRMGILICLLYTLYMYVYIVTSNFVKHILGYNNDEVFISVFLFLEDKVDKKIPQYIYSNIRKIMRIT